MELEVDFTDLFTTENSDDMLLIFWTNTPCSNYVKINMIFIHLCTIVLVHCLSWLIFIKLQLTVPKISILFIWGYFCSNKYLLKVKWSCVLSQKKIWNSIAQEWLPVAKNRQQINKFNFHYNIIETSFFAGCGS